ncbi:MAG: extracellular solute-binding protein [Rhodocyclaceae bacterium]|nr:extracellular solute-binding protein [Rhodocyclaceae bacterium]
MKRRLSLLFASLLLAGAAWAAPAKSAKAPPPPQEIVLRHTLAGKPLDALATLVVRFNEEEARRAGGGGRLVLEDGKNQSDRMPLPHLALFDRDDALALFGTRPRFLPLHKVMAAGDQRFEAERFYPLVREAVEDLAGRMQALPMGLSLPALFFNKTAFEKARLDPDNPPKTWWELQEAAGALREAGYACPLTSSRFAWVHVENVASQHGEPIVTKQGKTEQLAVNNLVNVKHLALLTSWYKSRYFIWSGPGAEGDLRFASGECAMLTGESSLYVRIAREQPDFPLGVTVLPHYDDVYGARPIQVLPDGAALWVLAADKKPERAIIARFIAFLLRPEIQREWVRATGFLPMTPEAVAALRETGGNPKLLDQAERRLSMSAKEVRRTKSGFGKSRIRAILDEEIQFVWGEHKPPKAALDAAVARAKPILTSLPAAAR